MKQSKMPMVPPTDRYPPVAARIRVSIATVSRTINHVPSVDPVLTSSVWKAVADLKYLPNTQARALVSGKSRLLGLIVSEITN
jgi:LacI family transcriptional regulator